MNFPTIGRCKLLRIFVIQFLHSRLHTDNNTSLNRLSGHEFNREWAQDTFCFGITHQRFLDKKMARFGVSSDQIAATAL